MKVEATQHKNIEVELSDWTVKNIILDSLWEELDIPPMAYIRDGNLMVDVEVGGGSHSWYNNEIIRKASEEDIAAVLTINRMVKQL